MMRCQQCGNIAPGQFVAFTVALHNGTEVRNRWQCTECSQMEGK